MYFSKTNWDNLILPEGVRKPLFDIVAQVGLKHIVYQKWGMSSNRGLGIAALFSGVSGTGKTTAAEAIANELKLDLYKIDLSTVISKYIGETEKNLRRIFDAAEAGGAILLFDEADALFGKRTEVKDSKDRHSNAEISYLLQKMEAYSGLAILTTNLPDAIDSAFKRRLRFVVEFAYPDAVAQERIWRSAFGGGAPTNGLDYRALAELNLTGGNIRSVALNAAFEAAQAGEEIGMKHVVSAALTEAKKLGNSTHKLEKMMSSLNLDSTRRRSSEIGTKDEETRRRGNNNDSDSPSHQVPQSPNPPVAKSPISPTPTPTRRTKVDPFSQSQNSNPLPDRNYSKMSPQEILDSTAPYLRNNDPSTALSILRDALTYYPDDSGLNFWLGNINCEGKLNYTEAVTAFERAEQGNGQWLNNPEGKFANWYWLACALLEIPESDPEKASQLCVRYQKAMPEGIYAQKAKQKFNEARFRIAHKKLGGGG